MPQSKKIATKKNLDTRIPITVLTGFLGSGKTTLLNKLLQPSYWASRQQTQPLIAVIMNEFGDIGLDHQLINQTTVPIALLNGGCVCCEIQGTLLPTLKNLWMGRGDGSVPNYERIIIETTGVADPSSIMETLLHASWVTRRHYLDGVITTVDAIFADQQLDQHFEALCQIATADSILLTKPELANQPHITQLRKRLAQLNPAANIVPVEYGNVDPKYIFNLQAYHQSKPDQAKQWLAADKFRIIAPLATPTQHHIGMQKPETKASPKLDKRIRSFSLVFDEPLTWQSVKEALETLVDTCRHRLLRMKAIVNLQEFPNRPVVLHAVQHVFYPSIELPSWSDNDQRSRFVFITADLDEVFVSKLLNTFTQSIKIAHIGK